MRRRAWPALVGVAAVLAAGATAAARGFGGGNDATGPARGTLPPATATVSRQTLVDTRTESGTLGYGETTAVKGRLAGTVTGVPAPGTTIARGQRVYQVDNQPVVLLYGSLPAYRELSAGAKGADVAQFERNLAALGYTGFTVDSRYTASTAAAVRRWQDDLGLPETGRVELGRVVYASGPVRVDTVAVAVGDVAQPGQEVLDHTGSTRVVTAALDVADQRLAKKGSEVTVTLPDGRTAKGTIAKTRTVIQPAEGNDPAETRIEVTVTLADATVLDGLDQASVDVAFTASRREGVLTVPVAALLALAEGGYGVEVVDGAATRIVAVRTGLFAGGRVEVEGDGLAEGMTVGMPA